MYSQMDQIAKLAIAEALSDADLSRICEGKVNIIKYERLKDMRSINEALGVHGSCIILYESELNFGHWVSLFVSKEQPNTLEFFDSYGLKPDSELKLIPDYFRERSGQSKPHLTYLIEQSSDWKTLLYNELDLQSMRKDTNTCGRWAALRIMTRDIPLDKFQRMFIDQHFDPDWYCSILTMFAR
jgi:hypothetical protein